ncbi:Protein BPS1, chloroplastic, partial [Cucurbita argyrosperma subsp. argyrosperma]
MLSSSLFSKLEDHHHHRHHESEAALSLAIQGFLSAISISLSDLGFDSNKSTSEIISFPWINRCFQLLRIQHRAFAKLIVEIDYPVRKHEASSGEGFFQYTLRLLELLNSISSCIADLSQARLRLSHALSLVESSPSSAIDRLKPIGTSSFKNSSIKGEIGEISVEVKNSEKESVVNRALTIMKQIGSWVCGLVISGLSGEVEVFMEMRRSTGKLGVSALDRLDFTVHKAICESGARLKEVQEVNDAVELLAASMADRKRAEDLQKKLAVLEKETDDFKKEVDSLFSDVLEERTKLLDSLRRTYQ